MLTLVSKTRYVLQRYCVELYRQVLISPSFRCHRRDCGHPPHLDLARAYRSLLSSHLCVPVIPAQCECRIHLGSSELRKNAAKCGNLPASISRQLAMWRDLHGRGRDSGMWWHGDLETVNRNIARAMGDRSPQQLSKPEDLYDLMGAETVLIREATYLFERPSATICFEAAFDEEHGVGILTDGTRVFGTGYQLDVTPYC